MGKVLVGIVLILIILAIVGSMVVSFIIWNRQENKPEELPQKDWHQELLGSGVTWSDEDKKWLEDQVNVMGKPGVSSWLKNRK